VLLTVTLTPILGPHPDGETYTEALLKDGNVSDGHSYSLHRVLTLTAQTYTESLLNNESTLDGRSYSPISGSHHDGSNL